MADDPKASHPFTSLSTAQTLGVPRASVGVLARRHNIGVMAPGSHVNIRRFTRDEVEQLRRIVTTPKAPRHDAWRRKHDSAAQENDDEATSRR